MNIAIFTPNKNPYSETFIQAHKNYLKGNIFYFYGRYSGIRLEGSGALVSSFKHYQIKLEAKFLQKPNDYVWKAILLESLKKNKIQSILVEYGTHAHHLKDILEKVNIPIIVHFHGYDATQKNAVEKCNNYKEVFQLATKVIAVSRVMENALKTLGCPEEKLVYNVYGPQPEFHKVTTMFSKKQFIGIGRFVDKKAPYYTILAFKDVLVKHKDAKLFLAGNGYLLETCNNLIKCFNLEDNVFCLGVITSNEYQKYLSESMAFVQHSITPDSGDMEGTPLAILEASVAGLPVISTKHAGIPDVIIDGETGLLCEEHDIKQMTKNMLFILDHPNKAKTMGEKGKLNISLNYSLDRHINVIQNLINKYKN